MIKKYTIHFSLLYLGEGIQKPIATLQGKVKGLTAVIGASSYVMASPETALIVAVSGFIVDLLLSCIILEEKKI